jgi:type I restriction enzyme S subunit
MSKVPEGWRREPIKNVCEEIIDCVNKTASVVEYETPFKMIRTTNIRNGRVNTKDVRYVLEPVYREWIRRGAPKKGDLIFTREAPVGEVGVLEDDNGVFLGQRTMMYRADLKLADNYYLFYSLQGLFCQKQIENFSNGGTVSHMRVPDCGEIIVNLPPLKEQQKIAKILSIWDKAISVTEQLIRAAQRQKKSLMQGSLNASKRFLGVTGFWDKVYLSDVCFINPSKTILSASDDVSFIPMDSVSEDAKIIRLEAREYKDVEKGFTPFVNGDVLIAKITPCFENGKGCYVEGLINGVGFGSTEFHVLRAKKNTCNRFIYHITNSSEFRKRGEMNMQGSAGQKRVTTDYLKSLKILVPSTLQEQQKIAQVLTAADREIELYQQKLAGLKQEKQALMQQLLTGKRRVAL